MKLRRIGVYLTPNRRDPDKLYVGITTSVDDFPSIVTFQNLLDFFNSNALFDDKIILSKDYTIDNGKIGARFPELDDPKTAKPEDFVYLKIVKDVGLIVYMYVHDTSAFRRELRDGNLLDYKIALNATDILDNKNPSIQAIDNYLVREQATTLGRLWVKYYQIIEPEDIKKQRLVTKLFNKL